MDDRKRYAFGANGPSIEELLAQRERMGDGPPAPSGYPSNIGQGLTYLGGAIANRMHRGRAERLDNQISSMDPTGDIVRALMARGGQ